MVCHKWIVPAGLPHRGPAILAREEREYPAHLSLIAGRDVKGDFERPPDPLTLGTLDQAFDAADATVVMSAGFLSGRSQPDDLDARGRVTAMVRGLLGSLTVGNLGALAPAYVEAGMALALRGDRDGGHAALLPLIANGQRPAPEAYLAAYYLAQLGDPSGWAALEALLHSPTDHYRLMAARHLIGFRPYDGTVVDGRVIDVRAALLEVIADPSPYVHREGPSLVAEAGVEGAREILAAVAEQEGELGEIATDVLHDVDGT